MSASAVVVKNMADSSGLCVIVIAAPSMVQGWARTICRPSRTRSQKRQQNRELVCSGVIPSDFRTPNIVERRKTSGLVPTSRLCKHPCEMPSCSKSQAVCSHRALIDSDLLNSWITPPLVWMHLRRVRMMLAGSGVSPHSTVRCTRRVLLGAGERAASSQPKSPPQAQALIPLLPKHYRSRKLLLPSDVSPIYLPGCLR